MASQINYERDGGGEPLLLLHGIGGDLHVWEPVRPALARERDVIAVDLPGFGLSPQLPDRVEPSPAALAVAVAELLDELGLDAPHVAGNSLGGWIAFELAKLGRARSVTALSPAGLWRRPLLADGEPARNRARQTARRLAPLLPALLATRAGRRLLLAQNFAHPERIPAAEALRIAVSYVSAAAYDATNLAMRRNRLTGTEQLEIPITVAWGELDRLLRRAEVDAPGVRTLILEGCGHTPMWDDPELVSRVLLEGSAAGRGSAPRESSRAG